MLKFTKSWGLTSPLFNKNNVEIHRIEGIKGGYSSEHKHSAKYNMFHVESGSIKIYVWINEDRPDITILKAGDSSILPPGTYHKFEVLQNCVAYEIYWSELNTDDIVRRNSRGNKCRE
jgi:quercetin dioxygenase-like cupin family protein